VPRGAKIEPIFEEAAVDFWDFACAFYAVPEVAEACLALQDRHGLDVNLLLLCCWLGASRRGRLTDSEIALAEQRVAAWRSSVLEPLRSLRRHLKTVEGAAICAVEIVRLRDWVKENELAAERIAQRLLLNGELAGEGSCGTAGEDAKVSLVRYLRRHGLPEADALPLSRALARFPEGWEQP
jgi:uncharacterized protein (TIGR02444 family)